MKTRYLMPLVATALMASGCAPVILDPLESDTRASSGDTSTSTPEPEAPSALFMRYSQWDQVLPPNGFFSGLTELSPDTWVFAFQSETRSCAAPLISLDEITGPVTCTGDDYWQVVLFIPPDRVGPGVIDLMGEGIYAYHAIGDASCGSGGGGFGPGMEGTLEIVSVSESAIDVKLALAPSSGWEWENGDYTAAGCM